MKIKVTHWLSKDNVIDLNTLVRQQLSFSTEYGELEQMKDEVRNISDAIAKLTDTLADKGLLSESDIYEIFNICGDIEFVKDDNLQT